jgi:predicted dehydrogenase
MLALCWTTIRLSGGAARGDEPLKVAIIGVDTSHAVAFTALINDPKAAGPLARIEVVAAFPGGSDDIPASRERVPGFVEQLRKSGVRIASTIEDAATDADAFLLESVDGRVHLEQFRRIASGKPVFVDKPAASSTADFIEMMKIAEETNTPFFSSSALRYCPEILKVAADDSVGKVLGASTSTPMQIEPHHPELFWYGIHGVEALAALLGPGCQSVVRRETENCVLVAGQWNDGRQGTLWALKTANPVYSFVRYGDKSVSCAAGFSGYQNLVQEIGKFFVTRKPPVSAEATREILAFMEAADLSRAQDGAPVMIADVIERAEQEVARRHPVAQRE